MFGEQLNSSERQFSAHISRICGSFSKEVVESIGVQRVFLFKQAEVK